MERGPALTLRILVITGIFLVVGALWVRRASLVAFAILVAEGTPSVPALTALVLLAVAAVIWKKLGKSRLFRREALIMYLMMVLALPIVDANGFRQVFPVITGLKYFATPDNDYAQYAEFVPTWLAPHDSEVIRTFYEGADNGIIPWQAWYVPLGMWALIFLLYSLSMFCMVALFRRPWSEHERLTFPLAELALRIAPGPRDTPGTRQLFREPLFWVGVGFAAIYNASNIIHAFSPQVPTIGQSYDLGGLLTEWPWVALRPLNATFRPEIVGLGYLVPVEILLSFWLFYLLFRVTNLAGAVSGYSVRGFPFERPQAMGSYLGMAFFLIFVARKHLLQIGRAALGLGAMAEGDKDEAMPLAWALRGFFIGLAALIVIFILAGVDVPRAIGYVSVSFLVALVYARSRAQTGLPITYAVPREDVGNLLYDLSPTTGRLTTPQVQSEVSMAVMNVIGRMTFPQIAAYSAEGIRLSDRAGILRSHLLTAVVVGLVAGILLSYGTHLTAYYDFGNNIVDGGTTQGGYRTRQAMVDFDRMHSRVTSPVLMDVNSLVARGWGMAVTFLLLWLRSRFVSFPLHPLGMALAGTFGGPTWFPVFLAWMLKSVVMNLGGARGYRTLTSAFLGLALGHFVMAGGVWGIVGAFNEEVAQRYLVWFA